MRTGDFFKSKFLKPLDFPEPKVVVLAHVRSESFRDSPEPKPVVYFKGVQKPLILNKTMAQFLEDASGTDVMTDWAAIRQWWQSEPRYNIGVACGSLSGIFVVDVDSHDAEARLAKLEAEHGKLPPTVEVITIRGRHLYFRYPSEHAVRNTTSRIAPGIDSRGEGGYVLAPPSIHPSGRAYVWSVDSANAFAAAPQWLLARINGRANGKVEATPVSAWCELVSNGADEGTRNGAATRLTGYLLRRNVNPQVALGLLQLWNAQRLRPPLDEAELETIVNSVAGLELRRRGIR